jgi:hypothetical protein
VRPIHSRNIFTRHLRHRQRAIAHGGLEKQRYPRGV